MEIAASHPLRRVGRVLRLNRAEDHVQRLQSLMQPRQPMRIGDLIVIDERDQRRMRMIEAGIARQRDIARRSMDVFDAQDSNGAPTSRTPLPDATGHYLARL